MYLIRGGLDQRKPIGIFVCGRQLKPNGIDAWQFVELCSLKIEWNDVNVLRLIELDREREILWNWKLKEYKNKNKRHDALLEIAVLFGVSKEEVDKKIRYLLSHFAREVKKENDTNKSGNGSDERYKSKSFAFKNLLFLRDRNKPKGSTDTEDNGTVDIEKKEATEELREDQAINLMKSIQSRKMQDRDEFSAFGKQVAMKMRKFASPHAKFAIHNAINSILFEAEMERFDNPPPPLFHHNPTAVYNTNLPLNIPPQFPPYCSPSPPIPASTNCLGGTTYVYSTSPSVQSEQVLHIHSTERLKWALGLTSITREFFVR
ncbi:hypothetical protein RN001_007123 [Aquatica leii]|uniref:MADF domain-containing protein n=1 Tax=Aquatica leii TaxID=1421715 RepID=A0AAN7PXT9_9COLE|nr:hypothetical protein RN001_007123 [Aquatica leii]